MFNDFYTLADYLTMLKYLAASSFLDYDTAEKTAVKLCEEYILEMKGKHK